MTSSVASLYRSVIDDVVNNVREAFLDEGVDEQILQELKQIWENKLLLSKAVPVEGAHAADHHQHHHPHTLQPQFAIQTQGPGAANAKRGTATMAQHLQAGSVVQPTVQYQYTTRELGEASKTVTITLPPGVGGNQKSVALALPAIMQQAAAGIVMSSSATAAATALPPNIAAGILQPSLTTLNSGNVFSHQNADGTTVHYQAVTAEQLANQGYTLAKVTQANPQQQPSQQVQLNSGGIIQLDGVNDTSDDDDDDDEFKDDDNDVDNDDEQNDEDNDAGGEEEEPLNSEDDVSDEDPSELFDTDNVIVCQYDKITRSRNKWKFHLKDGIMNLQGKDFVFQRASGDAEW